MTRQPEMREHRIDIYAEEYAHMITVLTPTSALYRVANAYGVAVDTVRQAVQRKGKQCAA